LGQPGREPVLAEQLAEARHGQVGPGIALGNSRVEPVLENCPLSRASPSHTSIYACWLRPECRASTPAEPAGPIRSIFQDAGSFERGRELAAESEPTQGSRARTLGPRSDQLPSTPHASTDPEPLAA
jgi:hypothetical protein